MKPAAMQVERTLVKSPPELWAELSDVEALTRHLALFGEIAITRVEPESKVAWEGEHASGTVELTASGWGTKVTLTAVETVAPEPAPELEPEPEPVAGALTSQGDVDAPTTPVQRPERRRWLRFWRRPAGEVPAPPAPTPDPAPPAPAPDPSPPTPTPPPDPNPPQIQAVLTQVLDDLGQAHHRPFSR